MAEGELGRRCALAVLLVFVLAIPSVAAQETGLMQGWWRAVSPLGEISGPFVALDDGQGSWRLDLLLPGRSEATAGNQRDLLRRHGEGWTLCGAPSAAFVQTWSSPWHQVGPATADFLGELAHRLRCAQRSLSGTAVGDRRSSRLILASWEELPERWRPPSRRLQDRGRLRRDLVERGLGAGGDGLVVTARDQGGSLRLTSTRWPVTIVLEPVTPELAVPEGWIPPAEAFLPLWPLADLLP